MRLALAAALLVACAARPAAIVVAPRPAVAPPMAELVESAPVETTLDNADLADAQVVWLDMIRAAATSLELAEFYISDSPDGRLHPVIEEILRAADRGVRVRVLIEQIFVSKYPETVALLEQHKGVELRHFDLHATMGGILHAKYFVVDDREAYVGSQNFDWRSLEHIQELGVRLRSTPLSVQLRGLFDADWDFVGGQSPARYSTISAARPAPGDTAFLGFSPTGYLPNEAQWDLTTLLAWLDGAQRSVDVQVLTYKPAMRDGGAWTALDDALRRAMARGVRVRLLVSSWGQKDEGLKKLAATMNLPSEVRVLTVPPSSKGDIPFARVAHAKFAVFDATTAWVGTSNWEGDYFLKSRNVSVFLTAPALARRTEQLFDKDWSSPYSAPIAH